MNTIENQRFNRVTWLRNAITLLLFIVVSTGVGCNAATRHDAHADQDVVLLGDSNTWLGGDDCTGVKGWGKWFAEEYRPGSIRSYARSGATWTNTANTVADTREYSEVLGDNNVIYNQVMRLVEDFEADKVAEPELVIISAGTNDAWFVNRRPRAMESHDADCLSTLDLAGAKPSEVLTMQESVVMCCGLLRQRFPQAKIVLLTPMQTVKVSDEQIERAGDLIEISGEALGCGVIRLDKDSCVRSKDESVKKVYTYDGTHTSEQGAECNGRLVARRVCEMICQLDN